MAVIINSNISVKLYWLLWGQKNANRWDMFEAEGSHGLSVYLVLVLFECNEINSLINT